MVGGVASRHVPPSAAGQRTSGSCGLVDALGLAPPRRAAPCPLAVRPRACRADRRVWSCAQSRTFAELLIDCEEDRTIPAAIGRA